MNNYNYLMDIINSLPPTPTELDRCLRVAVRSTVPLSGPYVPATVSGLSSWADMTGEIIDTELILQQRLDMEDRLQLSRKGQRPVSGYAVLSGPPGLPEATIGWMDDFGDASAVYGRYIYVLRPEVLRRTLFVLGDSNNTYQQYGCLPMLTYEQTMKLLISLGLLSDDIDIPYIEALVLGGLNVDTDVEFVRASDGDEDERLLDMRDRWYEEALRTGQSLQAVITAHLCG